MRSAHARGEFGLTQDEEEIGRRKPVQIKSAGEDLLKARYGRAAADSRGHAGILNGSGRAETVVLPARGSAPRKRRKLAALTTHQAEVAANGEE